MTRMFFTLVFLLCTIPVVAQRTTTYEQVTVAATSIGLTVANLSGMAGCTVRLETAQVRWRMDGTAPTTTVGTLLEVGEILTIPHILDARFIRFIRTGAVSGLLNSTCWPQP